MSQWWDVQAGPQAVASDNSFDTPRLAETSTTDAFNTSEPVQADTGSAWSNRLWNIVGDVVDYGITRDAARHGITPTGAPASSPATAQGQASALPRWVLPVALVGGLVAAIWVARK